MFLNSTAIQYQRQSGSDILLLFITWLLLYYNTLEYFYFTQYNDIRQTGQTDHPSRGHDLQTMQN